MGLISHFHHLQASTDADATEFPVLYLFESAADLAEGCQLVTITYEQVA